MNMRAVSRPAVDLQRSIDKCRPFAHSHQPEVTVNRVGFRVEAGAVISYIQRYLICVDIQPQPDIAGLCVTYRIVQGFFCHAIQIQFNF